MKKFKISGPVATCCEALRRAGFAAYPVGGGVRDLLLGKKPADWDITTAALPQQIQGLFDCTIPTGIAHGTVTVLLDGTPLEVTTFRSEKTYSDGRHPDEVSFGVSLPEDLQRRDFTINAMALDEDGTVIDPFDGQGDLAQRLVRCVGDPAVRFGEDALRMLRCLRFAAQLGFSVEENTLAALQKNAALAVRLSPERVTAELQKTMLSAHPAMAGKLAELGLLEPYLPKGQCYDLTGLEGCPATAEERWRFFCSATGLEIEQLPVSRSIRRAVHYRAADDPGTLAITGGELYKLGLRGGAISAAQRELLGFVAAHPEKNTKEELLARLGAE
ncbi:MAG: tRNA nucleotidyltransferase [Oscillospiraceae bacterium]